MRSLICLVAAVTCCTVTHLASAQTAAPAAPATATPAPWFARINGVEIPVSSYDQEAREAFRKKFYHGTPPESELNLMLREVGEKMIDEVLLKREVVEKKIAADAAWVKSEIDKLEQRYANSAEWQAQRAQALQSLQAHFEERSRLDTLEKSVRAVATPTAEVRDFYDKNLQLFTEPEKDRLSIILFRVDPSSPTSEWEKAQKLAEMTKTEVLAGADFARLAKERSKDHSANQGGDLGYLHKGMISPAIEAELAALKPGDLGGPTRTLEGYVVFRLDGRIPSNLRDFASVEGRARELYLRQKADATWIQYLDTLQKNATIEISPAFEKIMQTPRKGAAAAN